MNISGNPGNGSFGILRNVVVFIEINCTFIFIMDISHIILYHVKMNILVPHISGMRYISRKNDYVVFILWVDLHELSPVRIILHSPAK